ncbi:uncharacterized protein Bfra_000906 [Botrytis fragariae]|uniref:Uncharacterized protein n=1 Tax=Botrytis fragariae TaxID=1964551 RepID=A0A8H6B3K7_9HELO|nr:uncharacterized protein Bfra_000906 [Botrytis fragariae]KAF5878739.1 hypothetical protein Bfra_000906 [Botrytis fragariae]
MAKVSVRCVPESLIEVRTIDPASPLKSGRVPTTSGCGKESMRTLVLRSIPDHDESRLTTMYSSTYKKVTPGNKLSI